MDEHRGRMVNRETSKVEGIAVVDSSRTVQGVTSNEKRYYITSHEDKNRHRSGHVAENIAMMNKIALNLLKNEKNVKVGVKSKRLKAGWDNDYMMKVLAVGFKSV